MIEEQTFLTQILSTGPTTWELPFAHVQLIHFRQTAKQSLRTSILHAIGEVF